MDPELFSKLQLELKKIRDRPDDILLGKGWNQAQRDSDYYNLLMNAIREHITGRFKLFGSNTFQDYEDAMQDLLELMGK